MKHPYLEVTFRKGKPLAAYLYLDRRAADKSVRCEHHPHGLVVDFSEDDRPIGIEITSPQSLDLADLNLLLSDLHTEPATPGDLAPLYFSAA